MNHISLRHHLLAGLTLFASIGLICPSITQGQEQLIPKPVSLERQSGAPFRLTQESKIHVVNPELAKLGAFLRHKLMRGTQLNIGGYVDTTAPRRAHDIELKLSPELAKYGDEAYRLEASDKGVRISASSPKGIFYAIISLIQILPAEFHENRKGKDRLDWTLGSSAFTILDYPRFAWRAFMLDEARHFFGMDAVKQLLDQMALLKMNVFHWGLTNNEGWRIEIKKYPRLHEVASKRSNTEAGHWRSKRYNHYPVSGYYTQDQIKEIIAYAAARQITILPEYNIPGHSTAAAVAYPHLSLRPLSEIPAEFGSNVALDPTKESTYEFISDVLDEYIALFPSPIIHFGGDEVRYSKQWEGEPDIEAFMKKHGLKNLSEVQMYFSNRVAAMIKAKGRRAMGWNEIFGIEVNPDGGGSSSKKLATDTIIHFWHGKLDIARQAIQAGHQIVNSDNPSCYLDYDYDRISLEKAYSFEPVLTGLSEEQAARVMGLGCPMWTEFTPTRRRMHHQAFPRTIAYAEVAWSPKERKDVNDFKQRLRRYRPTLDHLGISYSLEAIEPLVRADFPEATRIGQWDKGSFDARIPYRVPEGDHTVTRYHSSPRYEVTPHITAAGDYTVTLFYDRGTQAAPIRSVSLLENGRIISSDIHKGSSGRELQQVQYKINLYEHKHDARYDIEVEFDKKTPQLDSEGSIYLQYEQD